MCMYKILEQETCRKFIFYKPEGNRRLGWPAGRWLDSGEENPKIKSFRNWRRKLQYGDNGGSSKTGAVHEGL